MLEKKERTSVGTNGIESTIEFELSCELDYIAKYWLFLFILKKKVLSNSSKPLKEKKNVA